MDYSAVAIALVGALAAVNLLFTFGVIRRLREHTAELARMRGGGAGRDDSPVALPAGSRVGDFIAESVDGRPIALDSMGTQPLIGFFSPSCTPCKERLPGFVAHAASRPGGREGILAVIAGSPDEAAALLEQLLPVATVVVEPDRGPVQQAFGVDGFPAFVLVDGDRVKVSDFEFTSITDADAVPSIR
ncbi:TlpA disulfide reductase family protein [Micromonospora robiginosa]|uniref:TlpA disulfide reductase family protein n=1 Tax=Micromonospora robiginosa TaxID=2749844 RepID=A0A7L6B7S3_9ACTN|nr:TlpA disulfide reductase family protein [Micromonospora ferruginea]QLQ38042.1 TlpA disulfide reductase family protein [Micromonospora ferruginea]